MSSRRGDETVNLVSYIRVSKVGSREGDSFQSPTQQRKAIDAIVSLTAGARIVAEFEDLDESGGTMDRPGVMQAIAMVENGQADGIVCAYLDRWARNMEALQMIERWTKDGKTFISAHEQFDAVTPQGAFALGMMLLVAKFYRDQITERWRDTDKGTIARGVHVTIPYGYRRGDGVGKAHKNGGTHGQPLVIHEPEAKVVRRIFAQRISGDGASVIADSLNSDGVPSARGGLWTRQSVRALLRVRAYTGDASKGDLVCEDAHEAIVSKTDWQQAQTERAQPKRTNQSLLVGLTRCAGCGYVMGASDNGRGMRRYNCNRHHAEIECPSPTTAGAEALEALLTARFLDRYGALEMTGIALCEAQASSQDVLQAAKAEFARWRDDAGMREIIGDSDYRDGLKARKLAVKDAERAHQDAMRQSQSALINVSSDIWSSLKLAERRELLKARLALTPSS
jgi:DNA invertase Pin-like site-specific DNA recombinase